MKINVKDRQMRIKVEIMMAIAILYESWPNKKIYSCLFTYDTLTMVSNAS